MRPAADRQGQIFQLFQPRTPPPFKLLIHLIIGKNSNNGQPPCATPFVRFPPSPIWREHYRICARGRFAPIVLPACGLRFKRNHRIHNSVFSLTRFAKIRGVLLDLKYREAWICSSRLRISRKRQSAALRERIQRVERDFRV